MKNMTRLHLPGAFLFPSFIRNGFNLFPPPLSLASPRGWSNVVPPGLFKPLCRILFNLTPRIWVSPNVKFQALKTQTPTPELKTFELL